VIAEDARMADDADDLYTDDDLYWELDAGMECYAEARIAEHPDIPGREVYVRITNCKNEAIELPISYLVILKHCLEKAGLWDESWLSHPDTKLPEVKIKS
jgi:hypothetical protein